LSIARSTVTPPFATPCDFNHAIWHAVSAKATHVVWLFPTCGHEMVQATFAVSPEGLRGFCLLLLDQVRAFDHEPVSATLGLRSHPSALLWFRVRCRYYRRSCRQSANLAWRL